MNQKFAETLKRLRSEEGYSQQQLADRMIVNRSTIAKWESGSRLPDAAMIYRLAGILGVGADMLFSAVSESEEALNIIMVDDEEIILKGGMPVLEEVFPNAAIVGFTNPKEALEYAGQKRIALAVLDIEMGRASGLDLCQELLKIDPRINVVYLTGYQDYAFDAWETGACGFLMKPLTAEAVRRLLPRLRTRIPWGGISNCE